MSVETLSRHENRLRPVKFVQTGNAKKNVPFWDTVAKGKGGEGLYMPDHFPKLPKKFFEELPDMSDAEIAAYLQRQYIPPEAGIDDEDLSSMMKKALNFKIPLQKLDLSTFLLRLDRGPTASFKDIAARSLAALMEKYCETHQQHISLVVATSGDTGVAIANAFGGSKWVNVTILYPSGGVSKVQEKQMIGAGMQFPNVQVLPVKGSFDNAQDIAKLLLSIRDVETLEDEEQSTAIAEIRKQAREKLKGTTSADITRKDILTMAKFLQPLGLSTANSINLWRLLPQMTQYFVAYRDLLKRGEIKPGDKIAFAIPSGNVGHLTAGLMAEKMGLPVARFIAGTNANNIFANMIGKGMIAHRGLQKTSSPSMDILDPSNVERIFTIAARHTNFKGTIDFEGMKRVIKQLQNEIVDIKKKLEQTEPGTRKHNTLLRKLEEVGLQEFPLTDFGVTEKMLAYLRKRIWVEDVDTDQEVHGMIGQVRRDTGKILDPHGAVGYIAAQRARIKYEIEPGTIIVVFDTAHPHKFPVSLKKAGIRRKDHPVHPALEKTLRKVKLKDKPADVALDIMEIATCIKSKAEQCIDGTTAA